MMESKSKTRKKSESEDKTSSHHHHPKHYTMNIQRIFQHESNFKFRQLEDEEEDRELLSPAESEWEDPWGLASLQLIPETR